MKEPISSPNEEEVKRYSAANIPWLTKALKSPWAGDDTPYLAEYKKISAIGKNPAALDTLLTQLEKENVKQKSYLNAYRWAVCMEHWLKAHKRGAGTNCFTPIMKAMWNDPEPLCYAWIARKFKFWGIMHPSTWDVLKDASLVADLSIRLLKQQQPEDMKWVHWRVINATSSAKRYEECYQYGTSYIQKYPDHGRGYIDFGMGAYYAFMQNPKGPQARKYADAAIKALTYLKQHFPEEYKLPSSKRSTNGAPRWYFDDCLEEIRAKLK